MPRNRTLPVLAPFALTGALLLGGCGSTPDSTPATGSSSDAVFPITVERSGGLAGFADTVVVGQDGLAKVTTKAGVSTCTVGSEALAALARTAATATGTATASAQHPDGLVVTLTTSRGSIALQEGDLPGTAPAVGALLEDLVKPAAERTTCR